LIRYVSFSDNHCLIIDHRNLELLVCHTYNLASQEVSHTNFGMHS